MKILVRFKGDNDFGHIMRSFGQLLLPKVQRLKVAIATVTVAMATVTRMVQSQSVQKHLATKPL